MFKSLASWLDDRTGYKALMHEALEEPIPGGARWRYVFGSALTSAFMIQFFTGILLMFSYSPSSTTAWGSVYYINEVMDFGWFIRGIHHFGSQAMVVLLGMHLIQVLIAGAYRAPREMNWWFGMLLMFVTLGFSLTGYLLPWDQKGYWATKVATNIAGGAPVLGPYIQKIVVGGPDYGNQTLTRFYGLHVGVLPTLLVMCLAAHIALFRKHGVTPPPKAVGEDKFWPKQVFYDIVASLAVLGILVLLVVREGGANLDAPADPSSDDYPARPEWYFLSLFQMLKMPYFAGEREVLGTIVIPTAIMIVMFALPLLDKIFPKKFAHFFACSFVFAIVGAAGYLTFEAFRADENDSAFKESRIRADAARNRALVLAKAEGIPPEGAAYVLGRDPLYHGGRTFDKKCLSCHYFGGKGLEGNPQSAPDLEGYGTKAWVRGLLENPSSDKYFGKVPQCDGMARWKKSSKLSPKQLDDVADFVASFASIPEDMTTEEWAGSPKVNEHPGLEPFVEECGKCHKVRDLTDGGEEAPELFAWGSTRWMTRMIRNPNASGLYGYLGEKQKMPAFAEQSTANDISAVIRYIQGDYYKPGETADLVSTPAAGAPVEVAK
ncbi:MAG: cytochrome b N-terminal domain-containing protein [Isosphaeraceae bacterium]|nr:cytochrome b N-terminal domain-containing protein [Isosphaeraceae bacterium]